MTPPFTENETLEGAIKERCLAGIDTGIEAEEALLKLLVSDNFQCIVAVHTESRRPYGIKVVLVNNDVKKENVFAIIAAAEHKLMSC